MSKWPTEVSSQVLDVLIRDATLLDRPHNGGTTNVAIAAGRIAALDAPPDTPARVVVDARGQLLLPGLVDLHAHFFHDVITTSIPPDEACLPFGVTTAVDGGTSGCLTYAGLSRNVMDRATTRLFAFLNLGAAGFATLPALGELADLRLVREAETVALIRADARIRGIKVRLSRGALGANDAVEVLSTGTRVADACAVPLMLHIEDDCPVALTTVLECARTGDIVTHVYHGGENGILDERRRVLPAVRDAQRRGVVLDVGHGGSHFDIAVAREAIRQEVIPDTISTDGWRGRAGSAPQYGLPGIISELVSLGVGLDVAIRAATRTPLRALRVDDHEPLDVGAAADLALFARREGRFRFIDARGNEAVASELLEARHVFRDGASISDVRPVASFVTPETVA